MMFAELSGLETASLITGFVFGGVGLAIAGVAAFKKGSVEVSPQPFDVRVVEEMHKQFTPKTDFSAHVRDNDKQRGVLHGRIDDVVADYNEKFQKLPNEIVALLSNTGNLK